MKQNKFSRALVISMVSVLLLAVPSITVGASKDVFKLNTAYVGSKQGRFPQLGWLRYFSDIEKASGGKIKFIHHFGPAFLPPIT